MIHTRIAHAQSPGTDIAIAFVESFNEVILFPLITLLIGVALLVFFYGSFLYVANAENSQARETGKRHILFGIVGMFVMLSAFAILSLAANTFGLGQNLDCANNPGGSGCDSVFELPSNTGVGGGNTGGVGGGNTGGFGGGNP